jgi:SAM-dependent methyltransferase
MTADAAKPWDARLYDDKHAFVWKHGASLVELLEPKPGERIVDLGCGTGHLTAQLAAAGAEVIGIDQDPAMIDKARQCYPELRFEIADAREFAVPEPVGLLELAGLEATNAVLFPRLTKLEGADGLRNWISMFVGAAVAAIPGERREAFFAAIEDEVRDELYRHGSWYADYRRLRLVARRVE